MTLGQFCTQRDVFDGSPPTEIAVEPRESWPMLNKEMVRLRFGDQRAGRC